MKSKVGSADGCAERLCLSGKAALMNCERLGLEHRRRSLKSENITAGRAKPFRTSNGGAVSV